MAGKDAETCSILDEAATIQPPRLEDAGLEDCALPLESIMEAFARAAVISSGPRANDIRMAGKDVEACSISDEAATIQPPRLEDAGLEDCALPIESIMEAFARAAIISSSPRANDEENAEEDEANTDIRVKNTMGGSRR